MALRMCKASLPKGSVTGNKLSWTTSTSIQTLPGSPFFNRSYSRILSSGNPDVRIVEHGPRYGSRNIKNDLHTATKEAVASSGSPSKELSKVRRTWDLIEDTGEYHVTRSGTAMKITLTRPRNGNALTDSMLLGLTNIYRNLADDPSVYQVILASEGKFFCTGMDLSGNTNTTGASEESTYYGKVFDLYQAIDHVPQTTIALVNGPCYGGGVGLTFVCDVRLVSPRARWTMSEVKIGVSPAIISKYMVREWGSSLAREAMMSGREIAPETLKPTGAIHGISSEVKPLDELLDEYLDQLQMAAPRAASINKGLARLAWSDPDGADQAAAISNTFANMMAPHSEGRHGIEQFQKKVKTFSWEKFWSGRNPFDNIDLGSKKLH